MSAAPTFVALPCYLCHGSGWVACDTFHMEHDARCRICGGKGEILTERTVGPAGDFRFAEVAPALLGVVFGLVLFAFVGKADARVVDYRPPVKATAPQADGRVHRPPNEDKKPAPDARVVVPRCAPDQRGCK